MTTLVAYGSLCSGLGLHGLGRVATMGVEHVYLRNCRRGFGKLSQRADRYAMVLEPLRLDEPVQIAAEPMSSSDGIDALALTVSAADLGRISRREGYDPEALERLQDDAERDGRTLSQLLWQMLESVAFDPAAYRRLLFQRVRYTSPHYIPHPIARPGADPALAFLPPGREGTGDESVIPVRVATGMVEVLSVRQAWQRKSNASQIEYFSMCILAELHGLSLFDVLYDLQPGSQLAELLTLHLGSESPRERLRFCAMLGLSTEQYQALRRGAATPSWLLGEEG